MCAKLAAFNYEAIKNLALRREMQETAATIHSINERISQDTIKIGQYLLAMREKIDRGIWRKWLKAEFKFHHGNASNYMQAAKAFADAKGTERIQRSAMMALARPIVAEEAREEAKDLAARGEVISRKRALEIIDKHPRGDAPNRLVPDVAGVERTDLHRLRSSLKGIVKRWPPLERRRLAAELLEAVRSVLAEALADENDDADVVDVAAIDVDSSDELLLAAGVC